MLFPYFCKLTIRVNQDTKRGKLLENCYENFVCKTKAKLANKEIFQ